LPVDIVSGHPHLLLFEESQRMKRVQAFSGFLDSDQEWQVLVTCCGDNCQIIQEVDLVATLSSIVTVFDSVPGGEVNVACLEPGDSVEIETKVDVFESILLEDHFQYSEKSAIHEMFDRHKKIFSTHNGDIGMLEVTKHRIELHDTTPIFQKPCRFPEPICMEIENQYQQLQLLDIIEPTIPAWSSPVVPVKKKDGKMRMCIDYRKLNAVTKADKFPLPNLNGAVFGLHGVKFFTSLDLVRGYYHLSLDEPSR
jgi:hypothetical protein